MIKLCKNLKLNIELDENLMGMGEERIRIKLEDLLQLKKVEIDCLVNITTQQSHRYHIKEAIVIGLRRAVDKAITEGLIELTSLKPHGESTNSKSALGVKFPTGFLTEPDA